jgi:hypothetical protein
VRDQVAVAPNGELCVLVPLYRWQHEEVLEKLEGYSISLTNAKPIAYIVDAGPVGNWVFNAEFVEKQCEFLGDL